MRQPCVTRTEMIQKLYYSLAGRGSLADLNRTQIGDFLDLFTDELEALLLDGKAFRLGHLGTLCMKTRRGRNIKVPLSDKYVDIPDRAFPALKPSTTFRRTAAQHKAFMDGIDN